ncbi:MAG: family four-helix-bundle protein, partial [Mucilaginibacter sp.]|nr:family four-helix-bundle protein [Mucilaginibacter sp.]
VLGSDIDSGTSTSGKIHRAWLNLKATFSGHNEKSILEECEFGEDAILKAYDSALAEEHVPSYIKDILREQQGYLMEAHGEIKSLRDSA